MSGFTIYHTDQAKQSEAHEAVRYFAENLDQLGLRFEVRSGRPVGRLTREALEEERGSIAMATRIYLRGRPTSGHDLYRTVRNMIEMTPADRAEYVIRPRLKNLPVRERRVVERAIEKEEVR